jgi:predicted nucleic acid-binding protein
MRIYLDTCCLLRSTDDQRQERIRVEAAAVQAVLARCERGAHRWVSSEVVEEELSRFPDSLRRGLVLDLLRRAHERLVVDDRSKALARSLVARGLGPMDALHLAVAEMAGCDTLLTTDDRFRQRGSALVPPLRVGIQNPAAWLLEAGPDDE